MMDNHEPINNIEIEEWRALEGLSLPATYDSELAIIARKNFLRLLDEIEQLRKLCEQLAGEESLHQEGLYETEMERLNKQVQVGWKAAKALEEYQHSDYSDMSDTYCCPGCGLLDIHSQDCAIGQALASCYKEGLLTKVS